MKKALQISRQGLFTLSRTEFSKENSTKRLYFAYVGSLQTFGAFFNVELDFIAFVEGFEAIAADRFVMHEYIGAVRALDKTVPFFGVKPLYGSLFHSLFPFLFE
jgi:hypothetical protein